MAVTMLLPAVDGWGGGQWAGEGGRVILQEAIASVHHCRNVWCCRRKVGVGCVWGGALQKAS